MKIILGSTSKARQQVLRDLGYKFEIRPASVDEKLVRHDDFRKLPLLVAQAKSEALQKEIKEPVILITADSVVVYQSELREKPKDEVQAWEFLRSYGQGPVEIISAVWIANTKTKKTASGVESGKIYFHKIPDQVIDELVKHGHVLEAAGAFIAEYPPIKKYIVYTEGNMDAIMGLPGELTKQLISELSDEK